MRYLVSFALLFALIGAALIVPNTALAQSDEYTCHQARLEYTNNTGGELSLYVTRYDNGQGKADGPRVKFATLADGATFDGYVREPAKRDSGMGFLITTSAGGVITFLGIEPCGLFADARLNSYDAAATVTVYNTNDEYFDFYGVNPSNGIGQRILRLSVEEIATAISRAESSETNRLIEEASGVSVYALSSGVCQMNVFQPDGKLYEFEWACNIAEAATE